METFLEWWPAVAGILGAVVLATPTPVDNAALVCARKLVGALEERQAKAKGRADVKRARKRRKKMGLRRRWDDQ